jgi:hypothetical protein
MQMVYTAVRAFHKVCRNHAKITPPQPSPSKGREPNRFWKSTVEAAARTVVELFAESNVVDVFVFDAGGEQVTCRALLQEF